MFRLKRAIDAMKYALAYYNGKDVIIRDDYIATKLWCEEDIRLQLIDKGYKGTEEQVYAVMNTGCLKMLNDCTDQDWEIISYAIDEANLTQKWWLEGSDE